MATKKKVVTVTKPAFKSKQEEMKASDKRYRELKAQRRIARAQEDKAAADNHKIIVKGIEQRWSYVGTAPATPPIQLVKKVKPESDTPKN